MLFLQEAIFKIIYLLFIYLFIYLFVCLFIYLFHQVKTNKVWHMAFDTETISKWLVYYKTFVLSTADSSNIEDLMMNHKK